MPVVCCVNTLLVFLTLTEVREDPMSSMLAKIRSGEVHLKKVTTVSCRLSRNPIDHHHVNLLSTSMFTSPKNPQEKKEGSNENSIVTLCV